MARKYLYENLPFVEGKKYRKNNQKFSSSPAVPVVDLVDDCLSRKPQKIKTVDLTEEPEIIDLEETFSQLNTTLSKLDKTVSDLDIQFIGSVGVPRPKNGEHEVQVVNVTSSSSPPRSSAPCEVMCVGSTGKRKKGKLNASNICVTIQNSLSPTSLRKRRCRFPPHKGVAETPSRKGLVQTPSRKGASQTPSCKGIVQTPSRKSATQTPSCNGVVQTPSPSWNGKPTSKKRINRLGRQKKLKILQSYSSTGSSPLRPLSDNILKYYEGLGGVLNKIKKSKKSPLKTHVSKIQPGNKTKNRSPSPKKKSALKKLNDEALMRLLHKSPKSKRKGQPSPDSSVFSNYRKHKSPKSKRNGPDSAAFTNCSQKSKIKQTFANKGERNTFNPNPCVLDVEGLRPVVIDGCNVAYRHGKGEFSTRGLKICVDYFANRGHTNVKVFLPQHRQGCFSQEMLADLSSKCDMVFTPSQCINGVMKTPYDDRFIVQYAFEFGGVIVTCDHYRDLLAENPLWRPTIQKRLLMFTWVDDFLMFPMDPLGRAGPTLDEFLRF